MEFTPTLSKIGSLFQSESFFFIPKYQRKYVWKNLKIEDLWNDIQFNIMEAGNTSYFLGSFIFQKDNDKNQSIVIDGQQRLTSILVLLSIICLKFRNLKDVYNIKQTAKYCLLGDNKTKKELPRICNYDLPLINYLVQYCCEEDVSITFEDFLLSINVKVSSNDKQFLYCYNYYNLKIDTDLNNKKGNSRKIKYLEQLRESILQISAIEISVEDPKTASLVFETINARGQELEMHELIKNYLFMYDKPIRGVSLAKQKWETIVENVDKGKNTSLPKFIAQYCTFAFGKTAKKEIFNVFKANTPRNEAVKRLNNLQEVSYIYNSIVNANNEKYSKRINYLLTCFSNMGISIIRPLLLSVFIAYKKEEITDNKLCNYLTQIKNFLSIFVCICEKKTNEIEELIYDYSHKLCLLYSNNLIEEFINILKSKLPDRNTFTKSFSAFSYSKYPDKYPDAKINKQKCQYILKEFELSLQENDDYIISSFSIEHVKDDSLGGQACNIGNLVPLPKKKNYNLNGKSTSEKKLIYKSSCYLSTQKIALNPNIDMWDDESILNRADHLAQSFYDKIWKV